MRGAVVRLAAVDERHAADDHHRGVGAFGRGHGLVDAAAAHVSWRSGSAPAAVDAPRRQLAVGAHGHVACWGRTSVSGRLVAGVVQHVAAVGLRLELELLLHEPAVGLVVRGDEPPPARSPRYLPLATLRSVRMPWPQSKASNWALAAVGAGGGRASPRSRVRSRRVTYLPVATSCRAIRSAPSVSVTVGRRRAAPGCPAAG